MTLEELVVSDTAVRCPRCLATMVEATTAEERRDGIRSALCTGCGATAYDHSGWRTSLQARVIPPGARCCSLCGEPIEGEDGLRRHRDCRKTPVVPMATARRCVDCHGPLMGRSPRALRCPPCALERKRAYMRTYKRQAVSA